MRNGYRAVSQRKSLAFRKLALATLAALPVASWAFGVGDAELRSAYAQPLSLRVPITIGESDRIVDPTELYVRLMPSSAYDGMGLSAPPLNTDSVTLNVRGSGTTYWVDVRSSQRVREPMMTLLLEVRLGSMRVVRELPIMFDLPMEPAPQSTVQVASAQTTVAPVAPVAAPAPMVAAAPVAGQPDVVATPVPPVDTAAPVPLMTPAEFTPKPQRTIIRRQPKTQKTETAKAPKAAKQSETGSFKLAGWNQSGAAGVAPTNVVTAMPRFQLAQRFDSYAALVAAGTPPVPATQIPVITPKPVPVPVAVAEPQSEPSSGLGWWWAVLAGAAGAILWLWRRRQLAGPAPSATSESALGTVVAVPEPVVAKVKTKGKPTPAPVVEPEPEFEFEPEVAATPVPVAVPAPAVKAAPEPPPVAAPAAAPAGPQSPDLRKRLAELVAKASGDANLLRKAQLVSAYLDLNRIESAETLLSELEADAGAPARPKFTLIKG